MKNLSAETYQSISEKCKEWASNNLGKDFEFREYQLDCIINIIGNVLQKTKTQVCEAPTGTGKSLIAFISAGVLADYYNKQSYILCSDTALFKQYEADIMKYGLNFGCVCGKDNYVCKRNGLTYPNGHCQSHEVSTQSLLMPTEKLKPDYLMCRKDCKYIQSVIKGRLSKVTVLTYQLWFSNMDPYDMDENEIVNCWPLRDLVICDEAHKLPEIVQNLFSPKIDIENNIGVDKIIEYAMARDIDAPSDTHIKQLFNLMMATVNKPYASEAQRNHDMFICLKRYQTYLDDLGPARKKLDDDVKHPSKRKKGLKIETYMKAAYDFDQTVHVVDEYVELIKEIGDQWLVSSKLNDHTIVFNCARESDMVKSFFHQFTIHEFLMSATIGNLDNYRIMIGSDKEPSFDAFEAENGFDFTKSPIYYNKSLKLSYREKERNLPLVMQQIEKICKEHKGTHGIIQTGSYEFSKYLFDHASPELRSRLVVYKDSKERKKAIYDFDTFGKILIGPSLLEGLNFEGEKCRFIIVMKVPYASLADRLVKAKMSVYPDWYANDVINKMIQGVGRGVRSKTDWCETYVLDGCWNDVLTRSSRFIPEKFMNRMVEYKG